MAADAYISIIMPGVLKPTAIIFLQVEYVTQLSGLHGDTPERFRKKESVPQFEVRHIEHMQGNAFRPMLHRVEQLLAAPRAGLLEKEVLLDVTKTADVVLKIAREDMDMDVTPLVITGGNVPHWSNGRYQIPRAELIAAITDTFQSGQILISDKIPLAKVLKDQLRDMRLEPGGANKDDIEEDLMLSLGVALWRAREDHDREISFADRLHFETGETGVSNWDPLYGEEE